MYKHTGQQETPRYSIALFGHGAAYEFTRKTDGFTLWLDGDDAIAVDSEAETHGWDAVLDEYADQFTHGG